MLEVPYIASEYRLALKATMKKLSNIILIILLISSLFMFHANCGYGENNVKTEILIATNWGDKEGEFGVEKGGKTEKGYVLDFIINEKNIYILDAINDRIQIFDLNGKLKKIIDFEKKWEEFGVVWMFTLFQDNFYMLVGKPPYYGAVGIREIHKISHDGKFIKSFGKEYIPRKQEDYYCYILSDSNSDYLIGSIGDQKILLFDAKEKMQYNILDLIEEKTFTYSLRGIDSYGNPIITKTNLDKNFLSTIVFDLKTKKIKNRAIGLFSAIDSKNNFYSIRSTRLKIKNVKLHNANIVTMITKYDPQKKSINKFEVSGDVKVIKNGKEKLFRFKGNYSEISKVDPEGNIYHLIALEDGVLLRKITIK
jgi:hypothetical protein